MQHFQCAKDAGLPLWIALKFQIVFFLKCKIYVNLKITTDVDEKNTSFTSCRMITECWPHRNLFGKPVSTQHKMCTETLYANIPTGLHTLWFNIILKSSYYKWRGLQTKPIVSSRKRNLLNHHHLRNYLISLFLECHLCISFKYPCDDVLETSELRLSGDNPVNYSILIIFKGQANDWRGNLAKEK